MLCIYSSFSIMIVFDFNFIIIYMAPENLSEEEMISLKNIKTIPPKRGIWSKDAKEFTKQTRHREGTSGAEGTVIYKGSKAWNPTKCRGNGEGAGRRQCQCIGEQGDS